MQKNCRAPWWTHLGRIGTRQGSDVPFYHTREDQGKGVGGESKIPLHAPETKPCKKPAPWIILMACALDVGSPISHSDICPHNRRRTIMSMPLSFQDIILRLLAYWRDHGCLV